MGNKAKIGLASTGKELERNLLMTYELSFILHPLENKVANTG